MHADLSPEGNHTSINRSCILDKNTSVRLYFSEKHKVFDGLGWGQDRVGWGFI